MREEYSLLVGIDTDLSNYNKTKKQIEKDQIKKDVIVNIKSGKEEIDRLSEDKLLDQYSTRTRQVDYLKKIQRAFNGELNGEETLTNYLLDEQYSIYDDLDNGVGKKELAPKLKRIIDINDSFYKLTDKNDSIKQQDESVESVQGDQVDQFGSYISEYSGNEDFLSSIDKILDSYNNQLKYVTNKISKKNATAKTEDFIEDYYSDIEDYYLEIDNRLEDLSESAKDFNQSQSENPKISVFDGYKMEIYDAINDTDRQIEKLKEMSSIMAEPNFSVQKTSSLHGAHFGDSLGALIQDESELTQGSGIYFSQNLYDLLNYYFDSNRMTENQNKITAIDLSKIEKLLSLQNGDQLNQFSDLFSDIHSYIGSKIGSPSMQKDDSVIKNAKDIFGLYKTLFQSLNISYDDFNNYLQQEVGRVSKYYNESTGDFKDIKALYDVVNSGTTFVQTLLGANGFNASNLDALNDSTWLGSVVYNLPDLIKNHIPFIEFGNQQDFAKTFFENALDRILGNKQSNPYNTMADVFDALVTKQRALISGESLKKYESAKQKYEDTLANAQYKSLVDLNPWLKSGDIDESYETYSKNEIVPVGAGFKLIPKNVIIDDNKLEDQIDTQSFEEDRIVDVKADIVIMPDEVRTNDDILADIVIPPRRPTSPVTDIIPVDIEYLPVDDNISDSLNESIKSLQDEGNSFKQIEQKADAASESKKKFSKANKSVKKSADDSSSSLSDEANKLNDVGNKANDNKEKTKEDKKNKSINESIEKYINNTNHKIDTKIKQFNNRGIDFTSEYNSELDGVYKKLKDISDILEGHKNGEYWSADDLKIVNDYMNSIDGTLSSINDKSKELVGTGEVDKLIGKFQKDINDNSLKGDLRDRYQSTIDEQMEQRARSEDATDGISQIDRIQFNQFKARLQELHTEMLRTGQAGKDFWKQFTGAVTTQSAQFLARYFSFQDIIRYTRQAVSTVTQVNSALVELRKVSDASNDRIQQSFTKSAQTAQELGSTITDVINSTADWARLGYNVDQAEDLARVTTLFQTVGDNMTQESASNALVSTLKAYSMDVEESEQIVDKFNQVANNYAIDTAGISAALERSAAAFSTAHTSLDKSIALVTTANAVVQNPESVGTAFKTLSARLRGAKTELQELGEEEDEYTETTSKLRDLVKGLTGFDIMQDEETFKDIYEIVLGIGKEWGKLTDAERASLGEALAGKRNANVLFSVLNNIEDLESAYQTSIDSAGSAAREQEHYAESVQYSIDRVKASLQELVTDFLSSGTLKGIVEFGNSVIKILDGIVEGLGLIGTTAAGLGIRQLILGAANPQGKGLGASFIRALTARGEMVQNASINKSAFSALKNAYDTTGDMKSALGGFTDYKAAAEGLKQLGFDAQGSLGLMRDAFEDVGDEALVTAINSAQVGTSVVTGAATGSAALDKLKTAFKGLWSFMTTSAGIGIGIAAAVAGVAQTIKKIRDDQFKQAEEATKEWLATSKSLNDYTSQIDSLSTKLEDQNITEAERINIKQQLYDLQKQIVSEYGNEANGIDLINGELKEQLGQMESIAQQEAQKNLSENAKAYAEAVRRIEGSASNTYMPNLTVDEQYYAMLREAFDKTGGKFSLNRDEVTGLYTIATKGSTKEIYDNAQLVTSALYEMREAYLSVGDKAGYDAMSSFISMIDNSLSGVYKNYNEAIDEYNAKWEQEIVAAGGRAISNRLQRTVNELNAALLDGTTTEIKKAYDEYDSVLDEATKFAASHLDIHADEYFSSMTEKIDTSLLDYSKFKEIQGGDPYKLVDSWLDAGFGGIGNTIAQWGQQLKKSGQDKVDVQKQFDTKDVEKAATQETRILRDLAKAFGVTFDNTANDAKKINLLVKALVETGIVAGDADDKVTSASKAFDKLKSSTESATEALTTINTALSESNSAGGLTADTLEALRKLFGEDLAGALELTANGYHLNAQGLNELLDKMNEATKSDLLSKLSDQYKELNEANTKYVDALLRGNLTGAESWRRTRDEIQKNIDKSKELIAMYDAQNTALQRWQKAQSGGEESDLYDSVVSNLEQAKKDYESGKVGLSSFRTFVDLLSGKNLQFATAQEVADAYAALGKTISGTSYSAMDFFKEGDEGARNFVNALEQLGYAFKDSDGWHIDFDDSELSEKLGLDVEAVQILMRYLSVFGFNVNLDEGGKTLEKMRESAIEARDSIEELGDVSIDPSSFDDASTSIEKINEYIEQIQEDDTIDIKTKTDKLKKATNMLAYLVKLEETLSKTSNITINMGDLESQKTNLISSLKALADEGGGKLNLDDEDVKNALITLRGVMGYIWEINNTPAILTVDTSQADEKTQEALGLLEEFWSAYRELSVLQEEKTELGIDNTEEIDTATAKVKELAGELSKLPVDVFKNLGIDEDKFTDALDNIKFAPTLSEEALGTIKTQLDGVHPEAITVKTDTEGQEKLDEMVTTVQTFAGYDGTTVSVSATFSDGGLKYFYDNTFKELIKNKDLKVKVTTTYETVGTPTAEGAQAVRSIVDNGGLVNGTVHLNGTAHAHGNWGLPSDETALINEVKPEVIVRDGKWFTVNNGDPALAHLKKDDIVFNGDQTEELLKKGYITGSHGRMVGGKSHAHGTALSSATGGFVNTPSSVSKSAEEAAGDVSDAADEVKSALENMQDWIEISVSRLNRVIDTMDKTAQLYEGSETQLAAIKTAMEATAKGLNLQQQARAEYDKKLGEIGLAPEYAQKVRDGSIQLEKIEDEALRQQISDYQEIYEKILACDDAILDYKIQLNDLAGQRIDALADKWDSIITLTETAMDGIQIAGEIEELKQGFRSVANITKEREKSQEKLTQLGEKQKSIEEEFEQAQAAGTLTEKQRMDYQNQIAEISNDRLTTEKEILQTYHAENEAQQKAYEITKAILDNSKSYLDARGEWDEYVDGFESQQTINEKRMNLQGQWNDARKERERLEGLNPSEYKGGAQQLQADIYAAMAREQEAKNAYYKMEDESLEARTKMWQTAYAENQASYSEHSARNDLFSQWNGVEDKSALQNMIRDKSAGISHKQGEYNELMNYIQSRLDNGTLAVGGTEWTRLMEQASQLRTEIVNDQKEIVTLNERIREVNWDSWNQANADIDHINNQLDSTISLLDSVKSYDLDTGLVTDAGITRMSLYTQQIANGRKLIANYDKAIETLNKEYKSGIISERKYNEEMRNLTEQKSNAIKTTNAARQAEVSLIKEGIEAQVTALQKVINKRKEDLQRQKESNDYAKNIAKQVKDINKTRAQLAALEGDTTQAGWAKRQQLLEQLADQEEQYAETRADHEYEEAQRAADEEMKNFEEISDAKITRIDSDAAYQEQVIQNTTEFAKNHWQDTYDVLGEQAKIFGTTLEEAIVDAWSSAEKAAEQYKDATAGIMLDVPDKGDTDTTKAESASAKNAAKNKATATPDVTGYTTHEDKDLMDKASGRTTNESLKNSTNTPTTETKTPTAPNISSVTLNKTSLTLETGKSATLSATVAPKTVKSPKIEWKSGDPKIATVSSSGKVTAVKAGSVKITVTASNETGSKTATCSVTVKAPPAPKKEEPAKTEAPVKNTETQGTNKSAQTKSVETSTNEISKLTATPAKENEISKQLVAAQAKVNEVSKQLETKSSTNTIANMTTTKAAWSDYAAIFDPAYYSKKYPDLKAAFGDDASKLWNHFLNYGIAEGRQASAEFDPAYYKKNNPDVAKSMPIGETFKNVKSEWEKYYSHYLKYGRKENRKGHARRGARNASGLYLTDEQGIGSEAIITKSGVLRQLDSDTVFSKAQTDALWKLSKMENIDSMLNTAKASIVNMSPVINNSYGSLLTVNGNVDKDALPGLQEILKQACEYTKRDMRTNFRKMGMPTPI